MRSFFIKVSRAILALFGVTVFTACPAVMYATPYADYEIKGKVVDEITKEPVKGVRVIRSKAYPSEGQIKVDEYNKDTLYSSDGTFIFSGREYTMGSYSHIKVEDIDSLENGLYESNEVLVELTQAKRPKPNGWFQGFYQADNVMVEHSPKKSE
jgi:putative lipoprotein (rSAM/lipoprotein system)